MITRGESLHSIILDLMLPDGEGTAILAAVRRANLRTRVCVVTASSDPRLIERVNQLRPDCILRKPIDVGQLLAHLELSSA